MGLFKGREPLPAAPLKLRGGAVVEVVGEAHYQDALARICGGKTEDGHHHGCTAALRLEPHNQFDPNAVAIEVAGLTVGYLSRGTAPTYGDVLRRIAREGFVPVCDAEIRGGWYRGPGDEGHFGIVLFLAGPAYCHPHDSPPPPPPPRRSASSSGTSARSGPHTGASSSPRHELGMVRRKHYTDWVETVKDLKRLGHLEQARDLLGELCAAAEAEGAATGLTIPPWYVEQYAIVCRKLKDRDGEVAMLERYLANPLALPDGLDERLARLSGRSGPPALGVSEPEPGPAPSPAAGWYQDPWGEPGRVRWYDGQQWTGHVAVPTS